MFPSNITMYFIRTFLFSVFPALVLNLFLNKRSFKMNAKRNDLTEEDWYQAQKEDDGKIVLKIIKTNTLNSDIIDEKITKFVESYNKICKYNNRIFKHISNWIFSDINKYNEVTDDYHYKILTDTPNNTIYFQFKHKFIGGAYIRDLSVSLINTEQLPNEKFYPHSSFFNIIYLAKLLYNYRTIPKIDTQYIENYSKINLPQKTYCKRIYKPPILLKLIDSPSEIRRYVNSYTIDRTIDNTIDSTIDSTSNTPSSRTVIIFNALKTIQKALNVNRPIICYLPIAFNHVKGINNNIGIMFIDLRCEDTINTFNKRFEENKYHALATNFILVNNLHKLFGHNGNTVRNLVDVVLTFVYYTCDDNDKETRLHWSYENVGNYPIYFAISSCIINDKIVVAQTITSNIGEIKLPAEYEPIGYDYFVPK